MDQAISLDRRKEARGALTEARRRYPRLRVAVDSFYESASNVLAASEVELSLRGAFLACRMGDEAGTEALLRLSLPEGPMVVAKVVVVRRDLDGRPGMALRFVDLSDEDRMRLGAFLVRCGGLSVIPALEQRFGGWTRMPQPFVRRELRKGARA